MNQNDYPDIDPATQPPLPPVNDYLLRLRARELKVLEVREWKQAQIVEIFEETGLPL